MNEFSPENAASDEHELPLSDHQQKSTDSASPETVEETTTENSQKNAWGILKIGGFLVITAIVLVVKSYNKTAAHSDVKQKAYAAFADYEDQALIRRLIDKHHAACFEKAYDMGGTRSPSEFNEQEYISSMRLAIRTDLAFASGSMQKLIHDARFGDPDEPIRLPEEINNPFQDTFEKQLLGSP